MVLNVMVNNHAFVNLRKSLKLDKQHNFCPH